MGAGAGPLGRDPRGTAEARDRGRDAHLHTQAGEFAGVWQPAEDRGRGAALAAGVRTRSPLRSPLHQQAWAVVVMVNGRRGPRRKERSCGVRCGQGAARSLRLVGRRARRRAR